MNYSKPWRWTKVRKAIRNLIESGRTPKSIIDMMDEAYLKNFPDARVSEKAMTLSDHAMTVNAVAERLEKKS